MESFRNVVENGVTNHGSGMNCILEPSCAQGTQNTHCILLRLTERGDAGAFCAGEATVVPKRSSYH